MLEHHVDRPAVGQDIAHRLAADAHVAFIRRDEAGDHAQQRRLAAPGRTEDRKKAAVRDRERQFFYRNMGLRSSW